MRVCRAFLLVLIRVYKEFCPQLLEREIVSVLVRLVIQDKISYECHFSFSIQISHILPLLKIKRRLVRDKVVVLLISQPKFLRCFQLDIVFNLNGENGFKRSILCLPSFGSILLLVDLSNYQLIDPTYLDFVIYFHPLDLGLSSLSITYDVSIIKRTLIGINYVCLFTPI